MLRQLPDAAPLPGDVQLRGAGQDLCSGQVQGAERALQAATLAEDPISDFDDSFELITDDAPQPRPALRAFKGFVEVETVTHHHQRLEEVETQSLPWSYSEYPMMMS